MLYDKEKLVFGLIFTGNCANQDLSRRLQSKT